MHQKDCNLEIKKWWFQILIKEKFGKNGIESKDKENLRTVTDNRYMLVYILVQNTALYLSTLFKPAAA